MGCASVFKRPRWGVLLILPALLAACGCGNQTATVSGKVTYQAKPLRGGGITFVSTEGKPSISGTIGDDGSYSLAGVPVGPVKICVDTESLNPANRPKAPTKYSPPPGMDAPAGFGDSSSDKAGRRYMKSPDSYSKTETTDLTYTVTSGDQEYDVVLK